MSREYYLKWKGVESGPYSRDEINAMLASGRAGLLHKIRRTDGPWTLLKDFDFNSQNFENRDCAGSKTGRVAGGESFQLLLYGLSGSSFLSLYVYAVALAFCAFFLVFKDNKSALRFFLISSISFLCGNIFFRLICPVLAG